MIGLAVRAPVKRLAVWALVPVLALFLAACGDDGPRQIRLSPAAEVSEETRKVLGCIGADGQPQVHVQAYVGLVDYGLDVQQAVEAPRWLSGRFALGEPRDLLNLEAGIPSETVATLAARGHRVNRWPDRHELAGHAHGITLDPSSGMRIGGADPRSDGAAIGY